MHILDFYLFLLDWLLFNHIRSLSLMIFFTLKSALFNINIVTLALEKGMATHSSILAWIILWTEKPGGLQSIGLQRVGHDWKNFTRMYSYSCVPLINICIVYAFYSFTFKWYISHLGKFLIDKINWVIFLKSLCWSLFFNWCT